MRNEAALQAKIIKEFWTLGIYARKMRSESARGFPDLIAIADGVVVLMECKHPNGKGVLGPQQIEEIALLRAAGAIVYDDIDSLEKAYDVARERFNRSPERSD